MSRTRSRPRGLLSMCMMAGLLATSIATAAAPMPRFEVDPSWPRVPAHWKLGDVSSVAVDQDDNTWILHRPRTLKPEDAASAAPAVLEFDRDGKFIRAWGGPGQGYEWPEREHGIHVDFRGNVWIGGNNCAGLNIAGLKPVADDAILKFTREGRFQLQIGRSGGSMGNGDTANVHRAADAWVHRPTNELFVADGYGNTRVIVFDAATGKYKRHWGAFGKAPAGPDNCVQNPPKSFVDGQGPEHFNIVHALRVSNDGLVYVADRENRRVQVFTTGGKYLRQLIRKDEPFARDLALSTDRAQQFLYVGGGDGIFVVERKSMEVLGMIKVPGQLGTGHHLAVDSKGNLYIAQTGAGMQKLVFKGWTAGGFR
ncbi:MAG: hypothetical protein ABL964_00225 [Steroidobacteraceae bacterium]